jgi:hypothetical protein
MFLFTVNSCQFACCDGYAVCLYVCPVVDQCRMATVDPKCVIASVANVGDARRGGECIIRKYTKVQAI